MITVVNMIPNSWSDEQNQDTEANLSVNPANPSEMIATTFTFDNPAGTSAISPAMTGDWAPVFYSNDGGNTWTLQYVLASGAGATLPTYDVTVRYGGSSGVVYSGLISSVSDLILISRAPDVFTQQGLLVTRSGDQPFVETFSTFGQDKVYVGYNNSATIDQSQDAATAPAPAGFTALLVDSRSGSDGPKTRTAIHGNGVVYGAFYSLNGGKWDVVVVKDLNWGASMPPYQALIDGGDAHAGVRVASAITVATSNSEDADFGHDRRGWELALAVDPNDDQRVYICYSQGTSSADYTLHVQKSTDGGAGWSLVRSIVKAKNPGLAINMLGHVGFMYQQVVGATASSHWVTIFEHTTNDFATFDPHTLADTPSSVPVPAVDMATYLGDYVKLQAVGKDFYGIFTANNSPDLTHFPSGVNYQRNHNFATFTLLGNDNATPVAVSIDPFFFSSKTVDPSVDFYVRDWTDSVASFDAGVEPSTHPVFYTTSDVWNQRSNVAPTFNVSNQPNSEDPQIAAMGSNYAFARISRRAPAAAGAADLDVGAEFLFADFGLGIPYADVSGSPTTSVTFHAADSQLITPEVSWTLPATHSQHVCLAVQISTADDPVQLPSLLGSSPGWPGGTDTAVLNDNNKAQRNMGVYPVGQSGEAQRAMTFYALLHNAATQTRDMLVQYAGGVVAGEPVREVTVNLYGEKPSSIAAGGILRVPRMLPGENRWLAIPTLAGRASSMPSFHDFREVLGAKPLSGFRVVAQPSSTAALVRSNIKGERALVGRVRALFGQEPPKKISDLLERLGSRGGKDQDYTELVKQHVLKSRYFNLLEADIDILPVDIDAHQRALSGALRRLDLAALAFAHANLLHELDALLTMAQKARGDSADVLLNLQWQRAIYARARVSLPTVNEVRGMSMEFIKKFQQRKVATKDFPPFIRSLVPQFKKTATELGAPGQALQPSLQRLAKKTTDPNTVQKDHRAFLIELQSLV